jgi:signal transduction histidine kinase
MLLHFLLFAIAMCCTIATRTIVHALPTDIRIRAKGAVGLAVGLVVAEGIVPSPFAGLPGTARSITLMTAVLTAGLAWRIPDRIQSWIAEAGEVVLFVLVVLLALYDGQIAGVGTLVASLLCVVWALAGVLVGNRTSTASSHRAVGLVLVLGVTAATLSACVTSPVPGAVVVSLAVAIALSLERPPDVRDVVRRVLLAALGACAAAATTWMAGLGLDGRLLLPALMGALLIDAGSHWVATMSSPRPELYESLDVEHETLVVLGRLADPLGPSTEHVMFSLEHVAPGSRIELLRNPQAPAATQGPGAPIDSDLLTDLCRHGVLRSGTSRALSAPASAALRALGPNVVLLPVIYEKHVYGALLVRGPERFEGDLNRVRRFADLLGHRLETQRLFAELEEKQRLAMLGTFAAALMHDLRSPLGTVRLNMQYLQHSIPDSEQDAFAEAMHALDRVLDDLSGTLDFTRPLKLEMSTVDMASLVREVVASHRFQAERQGVTLEWSTAMEGPARARGDRARLLRVLENIVRNALEVSSRGSAVTITIDDVDDGVRVSVRDQGPGIDPALVERVFEPFVTSKREGMGLGLAIVRKIVESHRGRTAARSTPGVGTELTVWLPAAPD